MTKKTTYPWEWIPKNAKEIATWRTTDEDDHIGNIAASHLAGEDTIRAIASHSWDWNHEPASFMYRLLENPNLTPDLQLWLDQQSASWEPKAQWIYWTTRYGINRFNSNYGDPLTEELGPTRSFGARLIGQNLEFETASREILEIADHFAEMLWHDLAIAGVVFLSYLTDSVDGDRFSADLLSNDGSLVELGDEEYQELVSPGYACRWIEREESFNFEHAHLRDAEGWQEHFSDYLGGWGSHLFEGPFSEVNLGVALAAGIVNGDFENYNEEFYRGYLETTDFDGTLIDTEVKVNSMSPWTGPRYNELSPKQQMFLVTNLVATMNHPFLGQPGGLSTQFLICLELHPSTDPRVKAFIADQTIPELHRVLSALKD